MISEITKKRDCGFVAIICVHNYGSGMEDLLKSMNLAPDPEGLSEIDDRAAIKIIEAILWKDLAYHAEIMPKEQAGEYARWFIENFSGPESRFFTNGDWNDYHQTVSNSWYAFTDATFDAGVIVVSPQYAICLWVEDED